MKKVSPERAIELAYKKLYDSNINKIDKNLDALLKAKKFYIKNKYKIKNNGFVKKSHKKEK